MFVVSRVTTQLLLLHDWVWDQMSHDERLTADRVLSEGFVTPRPVCGAFTGCLRAFHLSQRKPLPPAPLLHQHNNHISTGTPAFAEQIFKFRAFMSKARQELGQREVSGKGEEMRSIHNEGGRRENHTVRNWEIKWLKKKTDVNTPTHAMIQKGWEEYWFLLY